MFIEFLWRVLCLILYFVSLNAWSNRESKIILSYKIVTKNLYKIRKDGKGFMKMTSYCWLGKGFSCLMSDFNLTNSLATSSLVL